MFMGKERKELIKYGKKLVTEGLTKGTGGNLSVFNREKGLISRKRISLSWTWKGE